MVDEAVDTHGTPRSPFALQRDSSIAVFGHAKHRKMVPFFGLSTPD